ncbi:MAG: GGDEF domain-containing protein [Pseudomonadota bacterium]
MERSKRYSRPLSLPLFDLDYFKQINGNLGHLAGDPVLTGFADVVAAKLREADMLARLGDDEFVALLPKKNGDAAMHLADRILRGLSERQFEHAGEIIDLRFSDGVA